MRSYNDKLPLLELVKLRVTDKDGHGVDVLSFPITALTQRLLLLPSRMNELMSVQQSAVLTAEQCTAHQIVGWHVAPLGTRPVSNKLKVHSHGQALQRSAHVNIEAISLRSAATDVGLTLYDRSDMSYASIGDLCVLRTQAHVPAGTVVRIRAAYIDLESKQLQIVVMPLLARAQVVRFASSAQDAPGVYIPAHSSDLCSTRWECIDREPEMTITVSQLQRRCIVASSREQSIKLQSLHPDETVIWVVDYLLQQSYTPPAEELPVQQLTGKKRARTIAAAAAPDSEPMLYYRLAGDAHRPVYYNLDARTVYHNTDLLPVVHIPIIWFWDAFLALGKAFVQHSTNGSYVRLGSLDSSQQRATRNWFTTGLTPPRVSAEVDFATQASLFAALERGCTADAVIDGVTVKVSFMHSYIYSLFQLVAFALTD